MDRDELVDLHPRIFHSASAEAWKSIQRHGLITTVGLVELFGVPSPLRERLLTSPRRSSTLLEGPDGNRAVIRDQKPMKFLAERLEAECTVDDFLLAINSRVFFWPNRERLERLRNAREYRNQPQVILHIDTAALVSLHGAAIELCRFNSGAVTHLNHPRRSRRSWIPLDQYPYQEYRRRHGRAGALAEVTVTRAVPNLQPILLDVEHVE